MIPVYNEFCDCVGRVHEHTQFGEVSIGRYMRYTRLKDGRYVLIYISRHDGEKSNGRIVSKDELVYKALEYNCYDELINTYPELKEIEIAEGRGD